jgi:NADH:ubiquinone oxidoreductase subunit 5 (subunit L)/multisubunit Na+/H+ antiporter MnhA subunit
VLNGFWSKELIFDAALAGGWSLAPMILLAVSAVTAGYAVRAVSLVFFGPPGPRRAHEAPAAMRLALGVLAAGAMTTWLLAGELGRSLAATLPFHHLESRPLGEIITEVIGAPWMVAALAAAAVGLLAWWRRDALGPVAQVVRFIAPAIESGFEWINAQVVRGVMRAASAVGATQTGQLNWNVAGIVAGLLALLGLAASGALR